MDLDGAGQQGVHEYPDFMNHAQIQWPQGATEASPMQQSHDSYMMKRCIDRNQGSPVMAQLAHGISSRTRLVKARMPRLHRFVLAPLPSARLLRCPFRI